MIPVGDIETALTTDDTHVLEGAFRALVAFPDGEAIVGARSVEGLCLLLARLTRALQHDQSTMPSRVSTVISTAVGVPVSTTATYAVGAGIVADHLYRWRGRFLQHAANGGTIA